MLSIPQRTSLVQQTLAILRQNLSEGRWDDWIPPERELANTLKISRPTLRLALQQLVREKRVRAEHGRGYRVLKTRSRPLPQNRRVLHLLSPDPVYTLRHQTVLWIEELHERIRALGGELMLHHGEQFAQERPDAALAQLIARHSHGAWLLAHSSLAVQRWFAARSLPCVIAGSPHRGIKLPHVTLDNAAVARHAVGVLMQHGHRRIGWLGPNTARAGDLIAEQAFSVAITELAPRGVTGRVVHTTGMQPVAVCRTVERLMDGAWRPTALILASAETYATVATHLPRLGLQVPRDVSLIARERENFLSYLVPAPCCYSYSPNRFGARLSRVVEELWSGTLGRGASGGTLLLSDYVRGDSVTASRD